MIASLLATLPFNRPLAFYGRGPNWLYGTLALQTGDQLFYQFDSRLAWITPPSLQFGIPTMSPIYIELRVTNHNLGGAVVVASHTSAHAPGDLVAMPAHLHNLFQL